MTGSPPQALAASQAPSGLEILWERYQRPLKAVVWLGILCFLGFYGWKQYRQMQLNQKWSKFAAAALLHDSYVPGQLEVIQLQYPMLAERAGVERILDELQNTPSEKFEQAAREADPEQKPYLLWLLAVHAGRKGDLELAAKTIDELKAHYPNHVLVKDSDYPIQVRDPVKKDPAEKKPDPKKDPSKEPELQPAKHGSIATTFLEHLRAAKDYVEPSHFTKPVIPADAPKWKITLEGDYGSFTIALMTADAPKICAKFEEIAASHFWDGIKVDEIVRPAKTSRFGADPRYQLHFGFESTKTETNRSDWDLSTASKPEHVVQEISPLSHFEGAVAAQNRDGKAEVDRLYFCASDCAQEDQGRQVFAYVIEGGIEVLRRICDSGFARAQDEDVGRGMPAENIVIKSVEKVGS